MLPTIASYLAVLASSDRVASRVVGATRATALASLGLVAIANRAAFPQSRGDPSHNDDADRGDHLLHRQWREPGGWV